MTTHDKLQKLINLYPKILFFTFSRKTWDEVYAEYTSLTGEPKDLEDMTYCGISIRTIADKKIPGIACFVKIEGGFIVLRKDEEVIVVEI